MLFTSFSVATPALITSSGSSSMNGGHAVLHVHGGQVGVGAHLEEHLNQRGAVVGVHRFM